VPRLVEALAGKKVVGAAAGGGHTALWTEDGKVFTFGDFFARTVSKRLAMQGAEVHPAPAHTHTNGEFGALGHKFALNFHKSRNFAWHFSVNRRKGSSSPWEKETMGCWTTEGHIVSLCRGWWRHW